MRSSRVWLFCSYIANFIQNRSRNSLLTTTKINGNMGDKEDKSKSLRASRQYTDTTRLDKAVKYTDTRVNSKTSSNNDKNNES